MEENNNQKDSVEEVQKRRSEVLGNQIELNRIGHMKSNMEYAGGLGSSIVRGKDKNPIGDFTEIDITFLSDFKNDKKKEDENNISLDAFLAGRRSSQDKSSLEGASTFALQQFAQPKTIVETDLKSDDNQVAESSKKGCCNIL